MKKKEKKGKLPRRVFRISSAERLMHECLIANWNADHLRTKNMVLESIIKSIVQWLPIEIADKMHGHMPEVKILNPTNDGKQ